MSKSSPPSPALGPRAAFRGVRVALSVAAVALPVVTAGAWLASRSRPVPAAVKPLPAVPGEPAPDVVIVDPANTSGLTVWGSSSDAGCGQVFLQVDTPTEAESTPESAGLPYDQIVAAAEAESHPPDAEPVAEVKAPRAPPRSVVTKRSLPPSATSASGNNGTPEATGRPRR